MTEQEWLKGSDSGAMLNRVAGKATERKLRLFLVGCCLSMWGSLRTTSKQAEVARWHRLVSKQFLEWQLDDPLLALGAAEQAVGVAERFADGMATQRELEKAEVAACEASVGAGAIFEAFINERLPEKGRARVYGEYTATFLTATALRTKLSLDRESLPDGTVEPSDLVHWADLLRDVFGNPFRKTKFLARFRTSTVVALAQQIYDVKDFPTMPILADALQDAGCEDENVLSHCRGPGPHVRGCWVCDLVLGKE